jgi:type I restriction enzyme, S subunit
MLNSTINFDFIETELGPLPRDWNLVTLGKYIDLQTGKRMKGGAREKMGILSIGGEHITDSGNISINIPKYITEEFYNSLNQGKVNSRDLLMVKDGATTGKLAFVEKLPLPKLAVNEHVFIIRSNDSNTILNEYLYYMLLSSLGQSQIQKKFHGLIGGVNRNDVESLVIPLAPLPEQCAIAQVLSTVRQAIEATERVIAAARELKRSMMKHLFTYGPVLVHEADQVPLKETEIGAVPEEWEVRRIEEITHELRNRNSELSYSRDDVLSVSNVLGFFPSDRSLGKDFSKYKIVKHRQFGYNPMRLNVGSIAFRHKKKTGIVSPDYIVFKANEEKVIPEYINQYRYTGNWWKQIQMSGQGSIRIRYYYRHIKEFFIPVPTIEVQSKVTTILELIDNKIQQEENRKYALEALFNSLLHNLMTGKIRVGIADAK